MTAVTDGRCQDGSRRAEAMIDDTCLNVSDHEKSKVFDLKALAPAQATSRSRNRRETSPP